MTSIAPIVHITEVEMDDAFAKLVLPSILNGTSGSVLLNHTSVQSKGDAEYAGFQTHVRAATVTWGRVPSTEFMLVVVLNQADTTEATLGSSVAGDGKRQIWHRLDLVANPPPTTARGGLEVLKSGSSVHLAGRAFEDTVRWFETDTNRPEFASSFEATMKDTTSNRDLGEENIIKSDAYRDVLASSLLEGFWENNQLEVGSFAVWQYFASATGVFRSWPGHVRTTCFSSSLL